MSAREERVARNEVLFREVNEQIDAAAERARFDGPTMFVCECGDPNCAEPLEVTLKEYEAARADPTTFLVVPGHEISVKGAIIRVTAQAAAR